MGYLTNWHTRPHKTLLMPYNTLIHTKEMTEAERCEKSNRVLQRYNDFYNLECSGLPHGTPITPEDQQAITLDCMIAALRCENLNREYNEIAIDDINDLIEALYHQGRQFIAKSEPLLKLAQERHGKDMDAV